MLDVLGLLAELLEITAEPLFWDHFLLWSKLHIALAGIAWAFGLFWAAVRALR